MALPFSYRPSARLFIGDTGALMIDVVQATRRGQLTSLLAAIHHDAALLYIARHVLIEVERDLSLYARRVKRPVDPDAAMKTWRTWYAPYIRVVDVPEYWGADDRNVQAVAARHDNDLPAAQLAFALAPCYCIAVDPDLVDNSYGHTNLLPMLLVAANDGEMNLAHQAAAAPVIVAGILAYVAYPVPPRYGRRCESPRRSPKSVVDGGNLASRSATYDNRCSRS